MRRLELYSDAQVPRTTLLFVSPKASAYLISVNPTKGAGVNNMFAYARTHNPLVTAAGPVCTSYPWARPSKAQSMHWYETNESIGE